MYPKDPTPAALPEMAAKEANWHEHLAGVRASAEARHQGSNPEAVAALATATAGPRRIGPYTLRPASQGTIWTLQRLAREFEAYATEHGITGSGDPEAPGTRELVELGLATLAFCDSRRVWSALDHGQLPSLISEAEDLMWETPVEIQMDLQAYFQTQMDNIRRLTPEGSDPAKKPMPPQTAGHSPEMPTPPQAPASPPANGSPPNTP